ncbi:hypothetical protein PI124_g16698 [Phytophthora idaei]|nr:hypothetical protein PI125_g16840 [Phytophthora idaei]KAG3140587.1 hypothetical protein PI126_g15923 [Phytophthora idaei]KAG3238340.1 hypothetical protein PI124_g16698 [Phytophthora idaei]
MMTLFCVVVGGKRGRFPVVIDPSLSVGHLKKAIKDKSATTITCDADELELFLAKQGDTWLTDAGASAVTLDERGYPKPSDRWIPRCRSITLSTLEKIFNRMKAKVTCWWRFRSDKLLWFMCQREGQHPRYNKKYSKEHQT